MHTLEPHYNWRDYYIASEDKQSPFFGRVYNEFQFHQKIYNYFIHPQWDHFGSATLYLKVLFADYQQSFAIIEFIGEWNDCINNDVMFLKRELIDPMIEQGITKFLIIGENVLNFHCGDYDYYEEWNDDVKDEEGWIVAINFRPHVVEEMRNANLHHFIFMGENYDFSNWRTIKPNLILQQIEDRFLLQLD